jgi:dTDP-4-dehydrorhamnose 3,5-epimerase
VLELEKHKDDRGFFARTFCVREFDAHGLKPHLVQCSTAFNLRRGTLRGFHWQASPNAEAKLVRVTRGAIHDVIVDLRSESATHLQYFTIELTADNGRMLYIPEGLAHGFQTLADDTEVSYQMSEFFAPESGRGARWNDPAFGVAWPLPNPIMNQRDQNWPDFES